MNNRFALVVLLSLTFLSTSAQITNIEKLRKWTKTPLYMTTGLNFSYTNNDGNYIYNINANAGVLYKFKDRDSLFNNKLFFYGKYALNRSEGQDFNNNWFLHLRYNKEIRIFKRYNEKDELDSYKTIRIETFAQTQTNAFLSINSRNLLGAGIRLKFIEKIVDNINKKSFHLYFGTAYMYEIEHNDELNLDIYNHRNSSYLTATFDFGNDKLKLVNTVYYQPLFSDLQNYRLSEEFSAEIPISDTLGFSTSFSYFLNNKTPFGDAEFSSFTSLGFTYNFKNKSHNKSENPTLPPWKEFHGF